MTLVGKIFTVLIFVMSIVFMSFSVMVFATHKNWKTHADNADPAKPGLKQQLEKLRQTETDLKARQAELNAELAEEQAARRQALATLETQRAGAEAKLNALQGEYDTLNASHSAATQVAQDAQTRLKAIESENTVLRTQLRAVQADLDAKFLAVVDLTDKLNQAESLKSLLDERNKESAFQMAQMKMVMDANGLTVDSLVSHIPPKVEAVILEVSDKDLVEISIGSDDGIKVGHSMEVYRGNTYLGRVVIRKTTGDRSVGQLLKELQRGQIKRGDRVTTKFS
jgi:multidrug efflux pump subunit AcrA (membrane-fusion protein)